MTRNFGNLKITETGIAGIMVVLVALLSMLLIEAAALW